MLFVSRHAKYQHWIRDEESEVVRLGSGREQMRMLVPWLNAEFKEHGSLTLAARDEAFRRFEQINPEAPFGAIPMKDSGVITGTSQAYEAYEPQFALSKFDTDEDIDFGHAQARTPEDREHVKQVYEQRLLNSPDFGRAFVLIEEPKTPAPWPSYDGMTTREIATMVKRGGFALNVVLAYESENQARPELLKFINEEAEKSDAEREARDATEAMLSTEIPG